MEKRMTITAQRSRKFDDKLLKTDQGNKNSHNSYR